MFDEVGAGLFGKSWPGAVAVHLPAAGVFVGKLVELDGAFVGHLHEEQVGDLLDVVAVVHAVVAESMAEAPEFLDDVGHFAAFLFNALNQAMAASTLVCS